MNTNDNMMNVSGSIPPTKIVFHNAGDPIITIHSDGRVTLGDNAQPTEAAAACIEAMGDMIQIMIRRAVREATDTLSAENERLREALWFYAAWGVFAPFHDDAVRDDGGDVARRALGETK